MHMTDGQIICHAQTTLFSDIWGHQVHFAISDLTKFHSLSHAGDKGPFFKMDKLCILWKGYYGYLMLGLYNFCGHIHMWAHPAKIASLIRGGGGKQINICR